MAGGPYSEMAIQQGSQAIQQPSVPLQTINTEFQALDQIANGGRFIVFGDQHIDSSGHNALANLMPTLSRSHVTTLGIELSLQNNDYLADLQRQVSSGLTKEQAFESLNDRFDAHTITGGEQMIRDMSEIIYSATKNNIRVVGIDARDPQATGQVLMTTIPLAQLKNDPTILLHALTRQDAETARNASTYIANDPQARMAIMFGQAHSCNDDGDRLADALQSYGSVTKISLVQGAANQRVINVACVAPDIRATVNAGTLSESIGPRRSVLPMPGR